MPLQTSGNISLTQIQKEFGGVNPAGLKEYYLNGVYVKANATGKIPSSGTVKLSNYYGGRVVLPAVPVDAVVSAWSAWGPCSVSCGGGTQTRTRTIITPASNGGKAAPALIETQNCNTGACPILTVMEENFSTATTEVYDLNKTTWIGKNNRVWTWKRTSASGPVPASAEPYAAGLAYKRGMPGTQGGFEIASRGQGGATWSVVTTVVVPTTIDSTKDMTLWCSFGYRGRVTSGRFECFNLTTNKSSCPSTPTGGHVGTWTRVKFTLLANTFKAGDSLELRWSDQITNDATGFECGAILLQGIGK